MTNRKYPKFDHPTLIDAICEVRYNPLPAEVIKRIPGSLVKLLSDEYPLFDVVDESPFKFTVGENIISENIHRYKFSSEDHNFVIAVKKDSFSFTLHPSTKDPYDKEKYYEKLCVEWEKIAKVLNIDSINRIGIRFINILEVNSTEINSDYLSINSPYLTKASLETANNFINRSEITLDTSNRFIVTSGSQPLQNKTKKRLILDLDRIYEDTGMTIQTVRGKVTELHADIEDTFFKSITDKYQSLMQPIE